MRLGEHLAQGGARNWQCPPGDVHLGSTDQQRRAEFRKMTRQMSKPPTRCRASPAALEHRRHRPIQLQHRLVKARRVERRPHAADAGQCVHQILRPLQAGRGHALQSFGAQQGHVDRRGGHQQTLIGANVGGRFGAGICCSRACKVSVNPGRPSASSVRPTMRPGICRTNCMRVVMKPKYGPPEDSARPTVVLHRTRCPRRSRPTGRRFQQRQRSRIHHRDHQHLIAVRPIGQRAHVLQIAEEVRLLQNQRGKSWPSYACNDCSSVHPVVRSKSASTKAMF